MTESIENAGRPSGEEVYQLARTIDNIMGPLHQGLRYGQGELVTINIYPEELDQSIDLMKASLARYAVLFSGTVIGTEDRGVVLVPESTINVLSELDLPCKIIPK